MGAVFRYAWPGEGGEAYVALGRDADGWWFESGPMGRHTLVDGTAHLAAFARWLLEPRPARPYESGFPLVRDAPSGTVIERGRDDGARTQEPALGVDVYLWREEHGGPERLLLFPHGVIVGTDTGYQVCPEPVSAPIEREALRAAAHALLDATQPAASLIPAAPAAGTRRRG